MMRVLLIVLACVADVAVAADGLGRLFFVPTQRAQLEVARAQRDRRVPVTLETEPAAPQGPDVVTYNGVVRRTDGKSTVWINGKPLTERSASNADVSVSNVTRDGAVSVAVPQADRKVSLKVGQSLEVTSGRIEESYARRATIQRPPVKSGEAAAPATVTSEKRPAVVTAPGAVQGTTRRDNRESDPDSGAAPPVERGARSGK